MSNNSVNIDYNKCIGCGICVPLCPMEAILIKDNKAVIEYSKCRGCKMCIRVCPKKAISC